MKLYYTKDKEGSPRHVVLVSSVADEKATVVRVGFHPGVQGVSRRGKQPTFAQPVSMTDLTEMPETEVTDELREAVSKLAQPAG